MTQLTATAYVGGYSESVKLASVGECKTWAVDMDAQVLHIQSPPYGPKDSRFYILNPRTRKLNRTNRRIAIDAAALIRNALQEPGYVPGSEEYRAVISEAITTATKGGGV